MQDIQNTSVCQSAGGGIKSHLVTALLWYTVKAKCYIEMMHSVHVHVYL